MARKMMDIYNLGTCFWEYDMYICILASMIKYRRTIHSIHLHTSGKFEIFFIWLVDLKFEITHIYILISLC